MNKRPVDRAYTLYVKPEHIPSDVLPALYRELRTKWVIHLKADQHVARKSLKPILDSLRDELKARGLYRTYDLELEAV